MPRISLWKENHSNDYKFFDNRIREMFTAGGVGIWVHKLIGLEAYSGKPGDATQPNYLNDSEKNIQDLLFLENRDRKYENDIFKLRGHYTLSDNDFNLSQFGMFFNMDTIFITFHINDMIERVGRKLIPGDVLEMPNMKDYWPLGDEIPTSLKKFYVINEVLKAAEGYSQTWWPHLYRVRVVPMVDSQEYKDILNQSAVDDGSSASTLRDIMSPYLKNLQINEALINQAESDVPLSGFNTDKYFILPVDANGISLQNYISSNGNVNSGSVTANTLVTTEDTTFASTNNTVPNTDAIPADPTAPIISTVNPNIETISATVGTVVTPTRNIISYLGGSAAAPNGFNVRSLTYFPDSPNVGEYVLRTDYLPNVLYRWSGTKWTIVNEVLRAPLTGNTNQTQLGSFINNGKTTKLSNGKIVDQRQALSTLFSPKSDF